MVYVDEAVACLGFSLQAALPAFLPSYPHLLNTIIHHNPQQRVHVEEGPDRHVHRLRPLASGDGREVSQCTLHTFDHRALVDD